MSRAFVLRRSISALTTVLAASVAIFVLVMVGPDPLATIAQEQDIDTAALASDYGWDDPWVVQYGRWLGRLMHGDLGVSVRTHEGAGGMIAHRLPVTMTLGLASIALALAVSISLAMWTAARRDTRGDRWATGLMVAMSAVPAFSLALVLQWAAVRLKDLTGITIVYVGGMPREGGMVEYAQRFALPVLVLAMIQVAAWMRFQRSELVDALGSDMLLAARGRGLPERTLLVRYALRRSLAPIVTLVALELGTLVGGTLIVETIFGLPGLGRLLVDSVQARDVVVTLDIVLIGAVCIVIATTAADLLNARLDPRLGAD